MIKKKKVLFENSKSGHLIVRLMGRYLSSPSDPVREAQKWYTRNQDLFFADYIIVLGAGSGYHLMELVRKHPDKKIVVIEPFKEVISAVKEIHQHIFMLGIEFVCLGELAEVYRSEPVKAALRNHYSVADYNLNAYQNRFLNFELIEFLNARSMEGLRFVADLKGYLDEFEDGYAREQTRGQDLLSINDVDNLGFDPFSEEEVKWKYNLLKKLVGTNGE